MNADQVLKKYWGDKSYPVNPYNIAYQNNIEIRNNPFLKIENIAGKIYNQNNRIIIEIDPWQTEYRQKFIVAHELGHYFLGHDFNIIDTVEILENPIDKHEIDANKFAAGLLMPKQFIEHILYKLQISDISKIAEMLDVSKLALSSQLKSLNLI